MRAPYLVVLGLLALATSGCSASKNVAAKSQGIDFADYSYMSTLAPGVGTTTCTNRMTIAGGLSTKCTQ